jgi:hypothetical protein
MPVYYIDVARLERRVLRQGLPVSSAEAIVSDIHAAAHGIAIVTVAGGGGGWGGPPQDPDLARRIEAAIEIAIDAQIDAHSKRRAA